MLCYIPHRRRFVNPSCGGAQATGGDLLARKTLPAIAGDPGHPHFGWGFWQTGSDAGDDGPDTEQKQDPVRSVDALWPVAE